MLYKRKIKLTVTCVLHPKISSITLACILKSSYGHRLVSNIFSIYFIESLSKPYEVVQWVKCFCPAELRKSPLDSQHDGRILMNGTTLGNRTQRGSCAFSSREDVVWRCRLGESHSAPDPASCWCLDFGLPSPKNDEKQILWQHHYKANRSSSLRNKRNWGAP